MDKQNNTNLEVAIFANGCFWCTEAVFQRLKGVHTVVPGYIGGHIKNPPYREVCTGRTGHAEGIKIAFDPTVISFQELLHIFFATHDPTTLNRQGNDVGTQYRSAIFYHDQEQKEASELIKKELDQSGAWGDPIVTEIVPFERFYEAENYHHNYYNNNKKRALV